MRGSVRADMVVEGRETHSGSFRFGVSIYRYEFFKGIVAVTIKIESLPFTVGAKIYIPSLLTFIVHLNDES